MDFDEALNKTHWPFVGFTAGALFILFMVRVFPPPSPPCSALHQTHLIPTKCDIQQRLVDDGYNIKVNGFIGKKSNEAWEDYEMKTFSDRLKNK